MYRFRALSTGEEREEFRRGYEANAAGRSGARLRTSVPLEYVATSRAVGCFRGGRLLAGYVLRYEAPFRCLRVVPEDVQEASPLLRGAAEGDLCELTCIWRNDGISPSAFGLKVWPRIVRDSALGGRRYILGLGFDNKMNDTYQVCSPALIYRGPSAAAEIDATVHVFAFTRPRIVANFLTNFALQMPRRLLRGRRGARS